MVEVHIPEKCSLSEMIWAEVVWFELPEVFTTWSGKLRAVWNWKARSKRKVRSSDSDRPSLKNSEWWLLLLLYMVTGWKRKKKQKPTLPHLIKCFYPVRLWRARLCGRSRRTPRTAWPSGWRESRFGARRRRCGDAKWSWCTDGCTSLWDTGRSQWDPITAAKTSSFPGSPSFPSSYSSSAES